MGQCFSARSLVAPVDNVLTIPDGWELAPRCAFVGATGFSTINIPLSVSLIAYRSFADCDDLQSVYIPGSVLRIEQQAFQGCDNLETLYVASSVREIERAAFMDTGLRNIKFAIPGTVGLHTNVFTNTPCDNQYIDTSGHFLTLLTTNTIVNCVPDPDWTVTGAPTSQAPAAAPTEYAGQPMVVTHGKDVCDLRFNDTHFCVETRFPYQATEACAVKILREGDYNLDFSVCPSFDSDFFFYNFNSEYLFSFEEDFDDYAYNENIFRLRGGRNLFWTTGDEGPAQSQSCLEAIGEQDQGWRLCTEAQIVPYETTSTGAHTATIVVGTLGAFFVVGLGVVIAMLS